jgi:hypothetical protein
MEEEVWAVTYSKDINRKRGKRQKGGVVVVRNGRASLYDCPEEDGRISGAALAFCSLPTVVDEGDERKFEEGGAIVYFDRRVPSEGEAAAPVAPQPVARVAAVPGAAQRALPPTRALSAKPAPFRAPATLPPRAPAPPAPVRQPLPLQPSPAPAPPARAEPRAAFGGPWLSPPPARAAAPASTAARAGGAVCPAPPLLSDAELLAQFDEWSAPADDAPAGGEQGAPAAAAPPAACVPAAGSAPPVDWDDFDPPEAADADEEFALAFAHPAVAQPRPEPAAAAQPPPAASYRAPAVVARSATAAERPAPQREGGAPQLRFPPPGAAPHGKLTAAVPATFPSAAAYSGALVAALSEFLQAQLSGTARAFHSALAAAGSPRDVIGVKRAAQQARLSFYTIAELSMCPASVAPAGKRRRGEAEAEEDGSSTGPSYFLKLSATGEREKSNVYAKGDVWALSSEANMDGSQGWCAVVSSLWHGPSPEGVLAVRLLSAPPAGLTKHRRSLSGRALRCFNSSGDLDQLQAAMDVGSCNASRLPLLPLLLRAPAAASPAGGLDVRSIDLMDRYTLNEDQACMVQTAEACALSDGPRVLLAQGPFGCGKTHTMVALVRHLCSTLEAQRSPKRILVAGFTNACVDGLLCGLLDSGFTDFVRAGSLRRIALRVLPYSVGSKAKGADERELKALLAGATTQAARTAIEKELAGLAAGRMTTRARKLNTCRVVASTTASCTQERLSAFKFDIVLIDEACQLTEPSALLPLVRFGARCCILVGDQAQLPPLLAGAEAPSNADGIQRSLFSRLMAAGHTPLLLRTQYRCHPRLSAVPNALYYGGRLLDGVSEAERPRLLPSLPPLTVMDVSCGNARSADAEVYLAARVVQTLQTAGIPPGSIAVLCFLHAHLRELQRNLAVREEQTADEGVLTISTIDAFQGQEREIIVLVASGLPQGFDTPERVNVALSRARRHLICICRSAGCSGVPWLDALLRATRPVPRSYLRFSDTRAPLPRWHEAIPPPPSPSAAPEMPAPELPSPSAAPGLPLLSPSADAPAEGVICLDDDDGRWADFAGPSPSGSARVSADADEEGAIELDDDDDDEPPHAEEDATPYLCSAEAEKAFAACAFDSADLWAGFKAFHLHTCATKPANAERAAFFATKLGAVARKLYAVRSGQQLQQPFVQTYLQAEAFVARHGPDGKHGVRLATLLERYADLETLRREHSAFAWLVEKEAADADSDDDEPCAKAPRAAAPPVAASAPDDGEIIDLSGSQPAREPERAELSMDLDNYLF